MRQVSLDDRNINHCAIQENNSCCAAVTGLSYKSCQFPNNYAESDLNSVVVHLAQRALSEDQSSGASIEAENVSIIVGNCTNASLTRAGQLMSFLGLTGNGINMHISNPLQGLDIAINELQTSVSNTALLVLLDSLEDIPGQNSYYISVFVIRTLPKAIEYSKKIYAAVALLSKANNDLVELKAKYKEAQIPTSSINLFTLTSKSGNKIDAEIAQLSAWFVEDDNDIGIGGELSDNNVFKKDPWCSLQISLGNNGNHSVSGLTALVETIIAIQQRTFLPTRHTELIEQIDVKRSPFYFNFAIRPWFHPQIHPHFRNIGQQLPYSSSRRRAAFHITEKNGKNYHLVAEEYEDANELKHGSLQADWPSELFNLLEKIATSC